MSPSTVQMQNLNGSPYTVSSAPEFRQEESTAVEEKLMVAVRIRPLSTNETGRSLYVVDSKNYGVNKNMTDEVELRLLERSDELFFEYPSLMLTELQNIKAYLHEKLKTKMRIMRLILGNS